MKIYLLIISILFITALQTARAQQEGSIKGMIKDTASGLPLNGATITVLLAKDSSLVSFSRTNSNGFFNIRNLDNGAYRLLVTHVGYLNISKAFIISPALTDVNFGILSISNKSTLLQE